VSLAVRRWQNLYQLAALDNALPGYLGVVGGFLLLSRLTTNDQRRTTNDQRLFLRRRSPAV